MVIKRYKAGYTILLPTETCFHVLELQRTATPMPNFSPLHRNIENQKRGDSLSMCEPAFNNRIYFNSQNDSVQNANSERVPHIKAAYTNRIAMYKSGSEMSKFHSI